MMRSACYGRVSSAHLAATSPQPSIAHVASVVDLLLKRLRAHTY
jgi:hypothetical protein